MAWNTSVANTAKNTGLDRNQLSMCISMVENGVNPEALAVSNAHTARIHTMHELTNMTDCYQGTQKGAGRWD